MHTFVCKSPQYSVSPQDNADARNGMVRSEKGMKYQSSQLVRTPIYISQTFYDAFRSAILIMALMGWSLTNSTLIFVLNSLIRTAVRITFSRKVEMVACDNSQPLKRICLVSSNTHRPQRA